MQRNSPIPDQLNHSHGYGRTHGAVDPSIAATGRGIWAVKWSFVGLCITALLQVFVVWISDSVALLADTIHNLGDAATTLSLWVAFLLARRPLSRRLPTAMPGRKTWRGSSSSASST
jgi:Co/Zn/Cd efflux system component